MTILKEGPEGEQVPYGVNKTNWKFIAIVIVLSVIVGGGILSWIKMQEVPLVEFPEIKKPEKVIEDETADWKTYRNEEYGLEIRYPEKLNTEFISLDPKSVPPKMVVSLNISQLVCEEFEKKSTIEFPTASQKKITVEGENYCRFSGAEGTAGTTYVTYRYSTIKSGKQTTLEFTLLYPDCGNYYGADDKMEKCRQEEDTFDPDILAHQMLSTFRFIEAPSFDFKVIGTDEETGWRIGRSDNYDFEIKYPSFISPSITAPSSYLVSNSWTSRPKLNSKGEIISSFVTCSFDNIPQAEPHHSFTSELRIGVSSDPDGVKDCLNFWGKTPVNVNISGREFKKFEIHDAASGHRADIEVYRTIRNNLCFSIEKLEYGYLYDELEDPSSPHYNYEYSQKFNSCREIIDQILSTFRFLE